MIDRKEFPEEVSSTIFALAKSKVLRARQFISELEAELASYVASDPVSAELLRETSQVAVRTKAITLKPGAIVGDVIHSLRASLDLMAAELARLQNKSDRDVYFPFGVDAETFEEQVNKKSFTKAGDDAVALLRTFKPYKTGNAALRALHDLDVQDKHNGIGLATSQITVNVQGSYSIDGRGPATVKADLTTMHYVFPTDIPVFAERNTVETLKQLVQIVEGILEAFASLVASRA